MRGMVTCACGVPVEPQNMGLNWYRADYFYDQNKNGTLLKVEALKHLMVSNTFVSISNRARWKLKPVRGIRRGLAEDAALNGFDWSHRLQQSWLADGRCGDWLGLGVIWFGRCENKSAKKRIRKRGGQTWMATKKMAPWNFFWFGRRQWIPNCHTLITFND